MKAIIAFYGVYLIAIRLYSYANRHPISRVALVLHPHRTLWLLRELERRRLKQVFDQIRAQSRWN